MSIENLTSQERAYLRGQANGLDAIFQLGKGGINLEDISAPRCFEIEKKLLFQKFGKENK